MLFLSETKKILSLYIPWMLLAIVLAFLSASLAGLFILTGLKNDRLGSNKAIPLYGIDTQRTPALSKKILSMPFLGSGKLPALSVCVYRVMTPDIVFIKNRPLKFPPIHKLPSLSATALVIWIA